MTMEILMGLMLFTFASSVTPGPNNLMLMASGVNFGFILTLPHILGVSLGFVFMAILVGLGVMKLFDTYPMTYDILKVMTVFYMLYLAYKIATSSNNMDENKTSSRPMTFLQAAMFQWINPKAWSIALTAISVYAPSKSIHAVVLVSVISGLVGFPCMTCWVTLGTKIKTLLTKPSSLKVFNYTMATLLVLSLYPIFY
jgi:threonine/homoserine/homoserine lactone efflux protein